MTPQEAQMLEDLVRKLQQTRLTEKDPDAEALLNESLGRDPDSLYKLAQTVLVQNLALNQARQQIEQLRQQPVPAEQPPARATSFLGALLGHHEPAAASAPPMPRAPQAPQYPPAAPVYYEPVPSGAGSFLRSAATTAAGVAAGALAFQGIESLLHGGSGYGGFGGMPVAGQPAEETIINNYYPDDRTSGGENRETVYDNPTNGPDMQPQGPYDAPTENDGAQLDDASYDPDSGLDSGDDSGLGDDYGDQPMDDGDSGGGDSFV